MTKNDDEGFVGPMMSTSGLNQLLQLAIFSTSGLLTATYGRKFESMIVVNTSHRGYLVSRSKAITCNSNR